MGGEKTQGEKRLDKTIEGSFPASDPPANTPVEGSRKAERNRDAQGKAKAGDDKARERDPHGVAPSEKAATDQPSGSPTSDRHDTETASGEHRHK